jgi:hypothetical protein
MLVASIAEQKVDQAALTPSKQTFSTLEPRISPKDTMNGVKSAAPVMASHGLSVVALLTGELNESSLIVYRCAEALPEASVQVFPATYFVADSREISLRNYQDLKRTAAAYNGLKKTNTLKRCKAPLTFFFKTLIYAPSSYLMASIRILRSPSANIRSTRSRPYSYWRKVRAQQNESLKVFDQKMSAAGWAIGMNEIQKESMLFDNLKRLTSIRRNHVVMISQDAKAKRRDLESSPIEP